MLIVVTPWFCNSTTVSRAFEALTYEARAHGQAFGLGIGMAESKPAVGLEMKFHTALVHKIQRHLSCFLLELV